jgi:hypothetical protein
MASDSIKDLTDKVTADLKELDQQIDGMENQIAGANTPELKAGLEDPPLADLNQRQSDLQTILDDLVKLGEDIQIAESRPQPWPSPLAFTLSDELMVQFVAQNRNTASAAGLFKPPNPAPATSLDVTFGEPQPKPPSRTSERK